MNLLLNFLMAFFWALATGDFTLTNFLLGLGISFLVLLVLGRDRGFGQNLRQLRAALGLCLFFFKELVIANLRVAFEVLTPKLKVRPGIVAIPLDVRSDAEITLLAILIALTPGSISLDVSSDRRVLFVHTMYMKDPESFRREMKEGFERRIREAFNGA